MNKNKTVNFFIVDKNKSFVFFQPMLSFHIKISQYIDLTQMIILHSTA